MSSRSSPSALVSAGLVVGLTLATAAPAQTDAQPVVSVARIGANLGGFGNGLLSYVQFGTGLARLGDLDGDGVGDLAVGAPGMQGVEGTVWILFLEPDGTVDSKVKIAQGHAGFTGDVATNDEFGASVSNLGDLDGDGVVDLAVGAREDDDGGTDRGAVWILFLRSNGTVKSFAKISSTEGGFVGELADEDRFGIGSAPLGDFDGDGVPDLAVGADGVDDGGLQDSGAIWLLLLSPDGSVREHHRISAASGGMAGRLQQGERFGSSLAALGHRDSDGLPDLAVGSPRALDAQVQQSGAAWLLHLQADGSVHAPVRISDGESGFVGTLPDTSHFGRGLAGLGDLDGDGSCDLAVGESQEGGSGGPGRVWLLLLAPDGAVVGQRLLEDSTAGALPGPPLHSKGRFGSAIVLLGDHDGDGRPDLAVGSPRDDQDSPGDVFKGGVRVLFLGLQDADLPVVEIAEHGLQHWATGLARDDGNEDADDSGLLDAGEDGNDNGLLDIDGGIADVALDVGAVNLQLTLDEPLEVGSPEVGFRLDVIDGTSLAAGMLLARDVAGNVRKTWVELQPGTVQTRVGHVISHGTLDALTPGLEDVILPGVYFASAIAALGDLDGDGVTDLAVSGSDGLQTPPITNSVWILFMAPNGSLRSHQHITSGVGGFTGQPDAGGGFGRALATLPDIDGDGVVELAVGEPRAAGSNGVAYGAVWILYLRPDGTVARHAVLDEDTGVAGLHAVSQFGTSLAVLPDLDGNGIPELVVGEPDHDPPPLPYPVGHGRVWIVSVDADGALLGQQQLSENGVGVTGSRFGTNVAVVPDLDGNGLSELAVTTHYYSAPGDVFLFFLQPDGTAAPRVEISDFDDLYTAPIKNGGSPAELASPGDVDGDGTSDLVVTYSTGSVSGSGGYTGSVWILLLRPDGTVRDVRALTENHGEFTGDLQAHGGFGSSVAAADLDGDGCIDLAVGSSDELPPLGGGMVWALHLHTVIDARPPLVKPTLVAEGQLDAFDDRPSEDVDGSERLEPDEDTNGNARIDQDSGIGSIALDAGASNLVLTVDAAFVPGTVHARFGVELADPTQPGSGVVLVSDVAGNVSTCTVAIPANSLKR